MHKKIAEIGKKIVSAGLTEAAFGNISVRSAAGNSMTITKTKAALDEIGPRSIIEVPIFNEPENTLADPLTAMAIEKTASSETPVHRRIYKETEAKAVVHAHCPHAVVMSLLENEAGNDFLLPVDSEGKLFLKQIPIISGGIGSEELAENAAAVFKTGEIKGALILGHGTIAVGETLEDAYHLTAQLEHSAKIKYLYGIAKKQF